VKQQATGIQQPPVPQLRDTPKKDDAILPVFKFF
jgi:hypothetical protein